MGFTAAVAGASGYAGGEVIRLLSAHPELSLETVTAHSNAGKSMGTIQPHLRSVETMILQETAPETLADHDVVFLALPHGKSGELADSIAKLSPNTLIVDCGADHRLHSESSWNDFYGGHFNQPWTYGVPELQVGDFKQRRNLVGTKRIAAPGCNASTVALAFAPGIKEGLIETNDLVSVLAVGPSGAGKTLKTNLLASEILGSASPYAVAGTHRHIPEIRQALSEVNTGVLYPEASSLVDPYQEINISFTPVLVPMSRGILATCTAKVKSGVTADMLREAWSNCYRSEDFVRVLPEGQYPSTASALGANTLLLSVDLDKAAGRVVVIAALDNLMKGTAGAAIQSVNIALGIPENTGLTMNGVAP